MPRTRSAFAREGDGRASAQNRTGLPDALKAEVEARSGLAMDDVRVRRNSPEPAKLGALAYTRGADIHLGSGQEEHLAHEAWHVVQQKQGRVRATTQMNGAHINEDARLEAEAEAFARRTPPSRRIGEDPPRLDLRGAGTAVTQCQKKPRPVEPPVSERVVGRSNIDERSRTVVTIEVIGHASPRWRGAKTPQKADDMNWRLAEKRAGEVRRTIQRLLRDLLPNRNLVFEYRFRPVTEATPDTPVRALDEPTDVQVDYQGRGSMETLREAGKRGREANDDPMRRVEVKVRIHSQSETDVEEDIERRERKFGLTRDWSMLLLAEAGVEEGVELGGIMVKLRNRRSGIEGTYLGGKAGVGAGVGVSFVEASLPDFEPFTTPTPMNFDDFDGASFSILSSGVKLGIGFESAKFRFTEFVGGEPIPDFIDVGGWSFGGVGLNFLSSVSGWIYLSDSPSETYFDTTRVKRIRTYESLAMEPSSERVYFSTGSSEVSAWQSDALNAYLFGIVTRSGL